MLQVSPEISLPMRLPRSLSPSIQRELDAETNNQVTVYDWLKHILSKPTCSLKS